MFDEKQKQILWDLFMTPTAVISGAGGLGFAMLSTVTGGGPILLLGLGGLTVWFGTVSCNCLFNYSSIASRVEEKIRDKENARFEMELNDLDRRLLATRGNSDENALRNLRTIYGSFQKDLQANRIGDFHSREMVDQVKELYEACIRKLKYACDLHETALRLNGDLKRSLTEERRKIIQQVEESVELVAESVNAIRAMSVTSAVRSTGGGSDLADIRSRLATGLEVARLTDAKMSQLRGDDMDQFSEYQN